MTQKGNQIILIGIVTALLLISALLAGCTGSTPQEPAPAAQAQNPISTLETASTLLPASG